MPKLWAIGENITTVKPATVTLSVLAICIIVGLRRFHPKWPGFLVAVAVTAAIAALFHLDVATIGSRFGGIPDLCRLRHFRP